MGMLVTRTVQLHNVTLYDEQFLNEQKQALGETLDSIVTKAFWSTTETALNKETDDDEEEVQYGPLNVIIFYPDDWRHDDLQDANPLIKTPTFTKLAKEGIRFTYNAVTTSICWISRATLFTGQSVSGHESQYLARPKFGSEPGRWEQTWPAQLQSKAGYFVGHVGKWQYRNVRNYMQKVFNWSSYFEGWIYQANHQPPYIAELARNEAIRFLRERPKDKPFAATVAFYPPKGIHNTEMVPPKWSELYEGVVHEEPYDRGMAYHRLPTFLQNNRTEARARYRYRFETNGTYDENHKAQYATISHIDKMCDDIIQELHDQGVYNNTMIIVTADNGEFHGRHALADKWYAYQESIRVPLIIKDPRIPRSKRGTTDDSWTLNIDLAATILGAAGLEAPPTMEGRDIADLYLSKRNHSKKEEWRKEWYYEFPDINWAIPPSSALIRKDWVSVDIVGLCVQWTMSNTLTIMCLSFQPILLLLTLFTGTEIY
jgi:arylsulfatase A-like enzyme